VLSPSSRKSYTENLTNKTKKAFYVGRRGKPKVTKSKYRCEDMERKSKEICHFIFKHYIEIEEQSGRRY